MKGVLSIRKSFCGWRAQRILAQCLSRTLYILLIILLLILAGCKEAEQTILEKWGLGRDESVYVSLNRDYDWYIDQNETGLGSRVNCGPACAVMAGKWSDANFSKSVKDARDTYLYDSHGVIVRWEFDNIYNFLSANDIPCRMDDNISLPYMKESLDRGNILIVLINMYSISFNKNGEQRIGKYYFSFTGSRVYIDGANHYIIVKGYRIVDGKTYFEVYDSNGKPRYADGTQKGKDRYYLASEVIDSAEALGGLYLVISAGEKLTYK